MERTVCSAISIVCWAYWIWRIWPIRERRLWMVEAAEIAWRVLMDAVYSWRYFGSGMGSRSICLGPILRDVLIPRMVKRPRYRCINLGMAKQWAHMADTFFKLIRTADFPHNTPLGATAAWVVSTFRPSRYSHSSLVYIFGKSLLKCLCINYGTDILESEVWDSFYSTAEQMGLCSALTSLSFSVLFQSESLPACTIGWILSWPAVARRTCRWWRPWSSHESSLGSGLVIGNEINPAGRLLSCVNVAVEAPTVFGSVVYWSSVLCSVRLFFCHDNHHCNTCSFK